MKSRYFYRRAASPTHISRLIPQLERGEAKLREVSSEIGMTYQNLSMCMQDAHAEGLINRKREDNQWNFTLTEKGKALAELCKGIKAVIEDWQGKKTIDYLKALDFGDKRAEEAQEAQKTQEKSKKPTPVIQTPQNKEV